MKTVKILPILILIIVFSFNISAQMKIKNDETSEPIFALKEKLKNLKLIASTEKDVKKFFGKRCSRYCPYNDDYFIYFDYIQETLNTYLVAEHTPIVYRASSKEYVGKLLSIGVVVLGSHYMPDSFIASENLKCVKTFTGTTQIKSKICSDNQGLTYFMLEELDSDGKTIKNKLSNIYFNLPDKKYNEVLILSK